MKIDYVDVQSYMKEIATGYNDPKQFFPNWLCNWSIQGIHSLIQFVSEVYGQVIFSNNISKNDVIIKKKKQEIYRITTYVYYDKDIQYKF